MIPPVPGNLVEQRPDGALVLELARNVFSMES